MRSYLIVQCKQFRFLSTVLNLALKKVFQRLLLICSFGCSCFNAHGECSSRNYFSTLHKHMTYASIGACFEKILMSAMADEGADFRRIRTKMRQNIVLRHCGLFVNLAVARFLVDSFHERNSVVLWETYFIVVLDIIVKKVGVIFGRSHRWRRVILIHKSYVRCGMYDSVFRVSIFVNLF